MGEPSSSFFLNSEDDMPYEEDLLRNPYSLRAWQRYLAHKAAAAPAVRFLLYERSVKGNPPRFCFFSC